MQVEIKRRGRIKENYFYIDSFDNLKHKNCGGKLKTNIQKTPYLIECLSCHKEFFLDPISKSNLSDWNENLYHPQSIIIDSTKLESVCKLITKTSGPTAYTSVQSLTEKELVEHYSSLYKRNRWHGYS